MKNLLINALLIFLCYLSILSCNSENANNESNKYNPTDVTFNDTQSNQVPVRINEKTHQTVSQIEKQNKPLIEDIESKVLYDADFNPRFYFKFRNNTNAAIKGVLIYLNPDKKYGEETYDKEGVFKIQKKITVLPHKLGLIEEKIFLTDTDKNFTYDKCFYQIISAVYSNGKKVNGLDILMGDSAALSR